MACRTLVLLDSCQYQRDRLGNCGDWQECCALSRPDPIQTGSTDDIRTAYFYEIEQFSTWVSYPQALLSFAAMIWISGDSRQTRVDYCLHKAEEANALASTANTKFQAAYFALMRSWLVLAEDIEWADRGCREKGN
jgi:hypothetical protein